MNIKKYLGISLVAMMLLSSSVALASNGEDSNNVNLGTVDVTGADTLDVAPNQGVVRISIENTDKDAKTAANENGKVMQNIQSKLLGLAIPASKIQTIDYSVYPEYATKGNSQVIVGYHANNSISVTVNDLNKISAVVDSALSAGANSIQSIDLGVSNMDQYKNQVLTGAINNAKAQAEVVAAALGKRVVGVKHVNIYNNSINNSVRTMGYAMAKSESNDSVATPIQGGTLQIKSSVNVTFYLQ